MILEKKKIQPISLSLEWDNFYHDMLTLCIIKDYYYVLISYHLNTG
jgi:hypothetical protein